MFTTIPANTRGTTRIGWLDSKHSFSFGRYYNPERMGFRSLRVINDDRVAAGMGFSPHPHDNMEIISYVLQGELAHKDSTGTAQTITRGDLQHMTAGSGVVHSEFNPSKENPTHFFQIWLEPGEMNAKPAYNELKFNEALRRDKLQLVASPNGEQGSISWRTDARLYATLLSAGANVSLAIPLGRHVWVQVMKGSASLNGQPLNEGDAAQSSDETKVMLTASTPDTEVLVFDLA